MKPDTTPPTVAALNNPPAVQGEGAMNPPIPEEILEEWRWIMKGRDEGVFDEYRGKHVAVYQQKIWGSSYDPDLLREYLALKHQMVDFPTNGERAETSVNSSRGGQQWANLDARSPASSTSKPLADNLLHPRFEPVAVKQVWVADITYIWSMSERITSRRVVEALEMAVSHRWPGEGLLVACVRVAVLANSRTTLRRCSVPEPTWNNSRCPECRSVKPQLLVAEQCYGATFAVAPPAACS